jgi:endoglucanase
MEAEWKGVSYHGKLKVCQTRLTNERGETAVLRGMSSHGMQWYPKFARLEGIRTTKQEGANVFRIAMYTDEGGYLTNPGVKGDVLRAVDDTLLLDMYAIIDWHINYDRDPQRSADKAEEFFREVSLRFKDEPGVLYEICNEPNGQNVTWAGNVKPYAQRIIPAIRTSAPDSVILVGSPSWSQDVDIAAADPLDFKNVMYTLHFYAGTHGERLRGKCRAALRLGAPVFASEWGASRADGSGGVFPKESDEWLRFLRRHDISWCNWSLADRDETSAALRPGASDGGWTNEDLTESGRYVFDRLSGDIPFEDPDGEKEL